MRKLLQNAKCVAIVVMSNNDNNNSGKSARHPTGCKL